MIETLSVGARFKLPYICRVVNNSWLGWIWQSRRGFDMDTCVQPGDDNNYAPKLEGLGRRLERVTTLSIGTAIDAIIEFEEFAPALPMRPQPSRCWID